MTHSEEAGKIKGILVSEVDKLISKISQLEKENTELMSKLAKLSANQGVMEEPEASSFGINVDEPQPSQSRPADSTIPAPSNEITAKTSEKTKKASKPEPKKIKETPPSGNIGLGPDSVDESNLDDLLANDPLASTVYHRLQPLKTLKYRLLAMQMGISVDRCKEAVDKLVTAGAVSLDDKGTVTYLE